MATKFSDLAHNSLLADTNFGDCNSLYIIFVQEIVIANTKFSDFNAPV